MEAQLRKIMNIEKMKDQEENSRYYYKYFEIFEITYAYLKTRPVLLYGGTALNELLPDKLKFYNERELPDIDIFCTDAKALATRVVKHFHTKGYNNITTSASEALHTGTYKVYVDAIQVLDITTVSKKAFDRLSKHSVVSQRIGLRIVDPQYIRMTLHLMLSKGDTATVHRWGKILDRVIKFYKAYPPLPCAAGAPGTHALASGAASVPAIVHDAMYALLKDTNYVLFGFQELELLLKKRVEIAHFPMIMAFAETKDLDGAAQDLIAKMPKDIRANLKVLKVFKADEFLPEHVIIKYKSKLFMSLFMADVCEGYNEYNHMRIASIHTIIRMYMSMMLTSCKHFEAHARSLECVVNTLTILSNKDRLKAGHRKLLQDVVGQCYGTNVGLATMRKQRILRMWNDYDKGK